jgi:hypothetical protein
MRLSNGWKSPNKQWDKFELRIRIGAIDILRVKYDQSDKYFEARLFNFGIKTGGRRR